MTSVHITGFFSNAPAVLNNVHRDIIKSSVACA